MKPKGFLKALARIAREFRFEAGPVRAQGAPAVLAAITGVVIAGGVAVALARSASDLPATLREAADLAKALRGERTRLNA